MGSTARIAKQLDRIRRRILVYETEWPRRAGLAALEFIDGNFKAQGYRDNTLIPWKRTAKGKRAKFGSGSNILIETGKLRRGMQMSPGKKQVRIFNRLKYAKAHNEGYKGEVTVRSHNRRYRHKGFVSFGKKEYPYGASYSLKTKNPLKAKKVTSDIPVKSHQRNVNIPRRQFMPSRLRGSRMLVEAIRKMTRGDIEKIMRSIKM